MVYYYYIIIILLYYYYISGILSYSMSQGESRGSEVDLYDLTYDGTEMNHYLSGGLGQLVDGDLGTWNFRLDLEQTGHKGYQWIGWRNDSLNADPIDIIFSFDELRKHERCDYSQ